jgi:hypothetical protein
MLRAFTEHPESVGETYFEHMASASGFAATMAAGAVACFLHGIFPFAFEMSGSRRIDELQHLMVTTRHRNPSAEPSPFLGVAEGI